MKYLSPLLRYYYFRFLKSNRRHIGILLPISILTYFHYRRIILHRPTKFRPNRTTTEL